MPGNEFACVHPVDRQEIYGFMVDLADKHLREVLAKKGITKTPKEISELASKTTWSLLRNLMDDES